MANGVKMTYVMHGSASQVLGEGFPLHQPFSYRVLVSMTTSDRWAAVVCECGESSRLDWSKQHSDYKALVESAWLAGCGGNVPRVTTPNAA